ncbi:MULTISPECIES: hypothetical protein [unclassified Streptomyces]|uniref:hypothetical protein n=1 Tax=unclassified Streptomyces TaxID=2593676 RepID=UPI00332FE5CD
MDRHEDTTNATSHLSTEDLAQPSGEATGAPGAQQPDVPVYPGEGTATDPTPSAAYRSAEAPSAPDAESTDEIGNPGDSDDEPPQLLAEEEDRDFRERWQAIQSKFVDDPREAVHDADTLVANVMQTLAATFAQHKRELEGQWSQGKDVNTEELRGALRRYRSFFNRLLGD